MNCMYAGHTTILMNVTIECAAYGRTSYLIYLEQVTFTLKICMLQIAELDSE